jgi:hypothetical protein
MGEFSVGALETGGRELRCQLRRQPRTSAGPDPNCGEAVISGNSDHVSDAGLEYRPAQRLARAAAAMRSWAHPLGGPNQFVETARPAQSCCVYGMTHRRGRAQQLSELLQPNGSPEPPGRHAEYLLEFPFELPGTAPTDLTQSRG